MGVYLLYFLTVILTAVCIILEARFILICLAGLNHFTISIFIDWLLSLLINVSILLLDRFKKIKIYYTICIVVFINIVYVICITVFYSYNRAVIKGPILEYISQHYLFYIKYIFSIGHWLLPIIYSLRRIVKKKEQEMYSP